MQNTYANMKKLNVLIVDDFAIMRDTLKAFLRREGNINVVGMVENGMRAVELVKKVPVDVILMDISMPFMDGIKATKVISECCPHINILILTMHDEISLLSEALKAGASGYLTKPISRAALMEAIQSIHQGKYYLGFKTSMSKSVMSANP